MATARPYSVFLINSNGAPGKETSQREYVTVFAYPSKDIALDACSKFVQLANEGRPLKLRMRDPDGFEMQDETIRTELRRRHDLACSR